MRSLPDINCILSLAVTWGRIQTNCAKLVELRLDYVRTKVNLQRLIDNRPCPVIVTIRRERDGAGAGPDLRLRLGSHAGFEGNDRYPGRRRARGVAGIAIRQQGRAPGDDRGRCTDREPYRKRNRTIHG